MNLGEKIETIIHSRTDGNFGQYLGSTEKTFGACRIDGNIYKVERNIEPNVDKPFWTVRNINNQTTAAASDKHYLGCIREEDFV